MVTIALDEQGNFETTPKINDKSKEAKNPIFIGGIMYQDNDDANSSSDYNNEKKRLFFYLIKVCQSVNARFPQDLHFHRTTINHQKITNNDAVKRVKKKIHDTLPEFFQHGTWKKQPLFTEPREGHYYIFSLVKSREGKKELFRNNISELADESIAGNLYLHMAEDIVERLIFHNPFIPEIDKIHIDLATRRVVLEKEDIDGINSSMSPRKDLEFLKLGYRQDNRYSIKKEKEFQTEGKSEWERLSIPLTNADNYRTAIGREMLYTGKNNMKLDQLFVKPIYYGEYEFPVRGNTLEDSEESIFHRYADYLFLYLSDIICAYLGYDFPASSSEGQLQVFSQRMEELSGNKDNLLFSYDSIDTLFRRAWKYMEEGDYYNALSTAYDAMHSSSRVISFYRDTWFSFLEDMLCRQSNISAYMISFQKLRESTQKNNLNQEKLLYIFEHLSKSEENFICRPMEDKSVLFELYNTGVSAYTHVGDTQKAIQFYQKCKPYIAYAGIERYLQTQNKMVVFLTDQFLYKEAMNAAEENLVYNELLLQMMNEITNNEQQNNLIYGKAVSQLGQTYAYMRSPKAEDCFKKALDYFDQNGANYYITLSYLLHYYIDMDMREKYESYAVHYFGEKSTLEQQLYYLVLETTKSENALISMKFALFVYIKALYVFYRKEISINFYNQIKNIEKCITDLNPDAQKQINGYPWNLIYKYIAFLALEKGQKKWSEKYFIKSENILKNPGDTLQKINMLTQLEYENLIGSSNSDCNEHMLLETLTYMHR